jgi:RHS repeat-associated protein
LGKDIIGSVKTTTNEYGTLEERYEYDAFGKPYQGDLTTGMNLRYTGKPYDTATGLYNYGYRDYKPEAARFTTIDPIRDGANWFVYVNNDPVNWVDLWGLRPLTEAEKKHHASSPGSMPVDYDKINVEDRMAAPDEIKSGLASVGAAMPSDAEITDMRNSSAALSLPDGNIYIPSDARDNPEAQAALMDSEINHQSQYQNGDPKQVVEQLMNEHRQLGPQKYEDPTTREYEAHASERDYASRTKNISAAGNKGK